MYDIIKTEDYKYEFYYKNKCSTLIIIKRSHTVFESDAILKVFTGKNAIMGYFIALNYK